MNERADHCRVPLHFPLLCLALTERDQSVERTATNEAFSCIESRVVAGVLSRFGISPIGDSFAYTSVTRSLQGSRLYYGISFSPTFVARCLSARMEIILSTLNPADPCRNSRARPFGKSPLALPPRARAHAHAYIRAPVCVRPCTRVP
jgi:hypothetical protein